MKFLLCGLVLVLLYLTLTTKAEDTDPPTTPRVYRLTDKLIRCSGRLSTLVSSLCSMKYKIVKRDISSVMMGKLMPEDFKIQNERQRYLEQQRWRRMRRQIASECCSAPCTIRNLIWYCAEGSRLVVENPEIFDVE